MIKILLAILVSISWADKKTVKKPGYGTIKCPSTQKLAREFVRAEVSGWRVPEAKASCVNQDQFKYFKVNKHAADDNVTLSYFVRDSKSFDIKRIRKMPDNRFMVDFDVFKVGKKGKVSKKSEQLVFWRINKKMQGYLGCAGLIAPPKSRFIKRSCYK